MINQIHATSDPYNAKVLKYSTGSHSGWTEDYEEFMRQVKADHRAWNVFYAMDFEVISEDKPLHQDLQLQHDMPIRWVYMAIRYRG